jgi:hypothetical protein
MFGWGICRKLHEWRTSSYGAVETQKNSKAKNFALIEEWQGPSDLNEVGSKVLAVRGQVEFAGDISLSR